MSEATTNYLNGTRLLKRGMTARIPPLATLALALTCLGSSACRTQASDTASEAASSQREPASPTPQIVAEGHKLLAKNPDAPIGSEHPLVIDGKRYIARIEKRDNPTPEPGRPPGEHKGVTIYEE